MLFSFPMTHRSTLRLAGISDRQLQVLQFIERFRRQHPFGPSLQEIADDAGIGKTTAAHHIAELLKRGNLCAEYYGDRVREGSLTVAPDTRRYLEQSQ